MSKDLWLIQLPPGVKPEDAKILGDNKIQIGGQTLSLATSTIPLGPHKLLKQDGKSAAPIKGEIVKYLQVSRQVSIPKPPKDAKQDKPKVPQREGMRLRHFPTGYGQDSTSPSTEKRKHKIETETPESTPKKSKKEKKSKKDKTPKKEGKVKKKKSKDADASMEQ